MLLENNTKKVIDLWKMMDSLKGVDKVRLAINLLENKQFNANYDTTGFTDTLKEILDELDPKHKNVIVDFGIYRNLIFISAKYMELSEEEKKQFSIEMLFNVYNYDFKDVAINNKINKEISVYDYAYTLDVI